MNIKKVILVSIILSALSILLAYVDSKDFSICVNEHICETGALVFAIFIPGLVLSLILSLTSQSIQKSWISFSKYWVLVTMFLVLVAPRRDFLGFDKEFLLLLMGGGYILISVLLVVYKSFNKKIV